ncbi:FAS1-like dehydratase domain-containing protein [Aquisalimonas asiatica]|uniref:Acyl dehydratase n=1 Tax=Aquisalimonas asiatica TaxID=406100 RepID=A0A1H8Q7S5_9GAMM|nr:MaoC family dehydratase N-terminal domain-containing protein [Aquisalimonas asiatica]SEO49803.1 Acyl dehydratase [Aquisalimonas asiatica]
MTEVYSDDVYWEDQQVGAVREFGDVVVDEAQMRAFAQAYDPRPDTLGQPAPWPGMHDRWPVASGLHVAGLCMRMMVDHILLRSSSLGSPGIQRLRWLGPVSAGDRLSVRQAVLSKQRHPRRGDVGFINNRTEVLNQHGRLVMFMESAGMFRLREPLPVPEEGA